MPVASLPYDSTGADCSLPGIMNNIGSLQLNAISYSLKGVLPEEEGLKFISVLVKYILPKVY